MIRTINLRGTMAGVIGTLALVLAACNVGGGSVNTAENGELRLNVVTPEDGASVSMPFEILAESSVPLGEPETGNHHLHFYFDTDINSPDYQIVYGNAAEVDRELTPGEHTIIVSLRNADHSDAGPNQEITVNVGEPGAPGETDDATPAPAAPTDSDDFDY